MQFSDENNLALKHAEHACNVHYDISFLDTYKSSPSPNIIIDNLENYCPSKIYLNNACLEIWMNFALMGRLPLI